MAVTKIWSIRKTLYLAIQYILNPNKAVYVSSHACAPETADLEFALTLGQNSRSGGTNKAFHMIQSFKPEEITPEQAHEIGKQLLEQHLNGKYEYVLTTHVDTSHIHNHVIFNASSYVDHKKYNDCKKTYYQLRDASDALCAEHGLSVIPPNENKGISHYEWQMRQEGTSWKQELQKAIDNAIATTNSYSNFLTKMKLLGYEMKHGKHIAFRAKNQERFTRGKRLGGDYTEEHIKLRIQQKDTILNKKTKKISPTDKPLSIMIELENNKKAIENKGYEHWAKLHNLKQAAKTVNLLKEYKIDSLDELGSHITHTHEQLQSLTKEIKDIEQNINQQHEIIKHLSTYKKTKDVYSAYHASKNKEAYFNRHTSSILLHQTASKALQKFQINPDTTPQNKLVENVSMLKSKQQNLSQEHRLLKKKMKDYQLINANIHQTLKSNVANEKDDHNR
ncbi:relaxase/mobilization nuclease domain-containing protein [Listeria booriae]|uniref:relaxase/mobilization nuclease domain-containing protein n=1 Tax=Listeria booriae TaxID=1552123 RepID=UPI001625E6E8|nr:relaxase/mobilization nuclease domain-containing protein [Listeria booriae]MBC2327252.1 relaxase/mobilization nuclease domain-containing protein [Listeria booriae]